MTPAVSVVMPVRDGGAHLAPAVASILGQTFSDLELLLIDDGSTDGAPGALDRGDPRLRVLACPGRGIVAALNAGIAAARGPFIARMDADDRSRPHRLATQLAHLADHPELCACGAEVAIFADDGPVGEGFRRYQAWANGLRTPEAIARELYIESPLPHPTALFRRETLDRLGGYRDPPWPEDYDLFLRADGLGLRLGKPAGVLLDWREHAGRLTRTDPRCLPERYFAAKARYLAEFKLPGREAVIWGAGPTGKRMSAALSLEGVRTVAFLDPHPRRLGKTVGDAPVHPREAAPDFRGTPILVAVGARGARAEIRGLMATLGVVEGRDARFVA